MSITELPPLDQAVPPAGTRSRFVDNINGLRIHVLEAGFEEQGRPCVLLLHGFPELAWSWRKVMRPLAAAAFHVVAPDLRGYGRTTGWSANYDSEADLRSFRLLNAVRDALGLISALGQRTVASVVGHDFGSPVAAWCALVRPDVFRSVALMSRPSPARLTAVRHRGQPAAEGRERCRHPRCAGKAEPTAQALPVVLFDAPANADMWHCRQGVHAFLRAYYYHKSADWRQNKPYRLTGWTAGELAKMPTYYIMDLNETMAETVAHEMPIASRDSRVPLAARQRAARLQRGV